MTTKYPMPKPHVHAELIKAWADDCECIEIKNNASSKWEYVPNPSFYENRVYRVKPKCDYALAKISEIGGDGMVELYLYWLDSGEVEYSSQYAGETGDLCFFPVPKASSIDCPFTKFAEYLTDFSDVTYTLQKKKLMVKQVLWIGRNVYAHRTAPMIDCWVDERIDVENEEWTKFMKTGAKNYTWHKVPSCTREVEVDD